MQCAQSLTTAAYIIMSANGVRNLPESENVYQERIDSNLEKNSPIGVFSSCRNWKVRGQMFLREDLVVQLEESVEQSSRSTHRRRR